MKSFLGSRGITPPILNLSVRWSVITISPRMLCLRERTPVLIEWKAGWARRLTRRFGKKRGISSTGIWTLDRSVHCLVCIPNTLSRPKVSRIIVRHFISLYERNLWNPPYFFDRVHEFRVCRSVLPRTYNWINQLDAAINPLNPELNPICCLLALLGAHHFLHVSRIRVRLLTFKLLMSYIWSTHSWCF